MSKCNFAEREKRIFEIYEHLIKGWSTFDIRRYCRQEYNIKSCATSDRYIKQARQILRENNIEKIENIKDEANSRLLNVFKKCMETGNYKEAINAQKEMDRINGIQEKIIKVNSTDEDKEILSKLIGE